MDEQTENHQDVSARIERATLEGLAGQIPPPPGMEQPEPEKKYPYSEADASGYAVFIRTVLVVWSSRWGNVEPLNEHELSVLSESAGRYIAWRFPGSGEEPHPGLALIVAALAVITPRALKWWAEKDAARAAADEAAADYERENSHEIAH